MSTDNFVTKSVSYKNFSGINNNINNLYKRMHKISKTIGNLPAFLCRMAGIDAEYYSYWMTGKLDDAAELIVLYLNDDERARALNALTDCESIC